MVALTEQEVEHAQHRVVPFTELVRTRKIEREMESAHLGSRTHEALFHRRLRREEGAREIERGERAEGLERQRELRLGCELGVTRDEHHAEQIVRDFAFERRGRFFGCAVHDPRPNVRLHRFEASATPQAIACRILGDGGEPRKRRVGETLLRPDRRVSRARSTAACSR